MPETLTYPLQGPISEKEYFALRSPAPGVRPCKRLGLGTAYIAKENLPQAIETLHRAWDAGFEFVDSAPMYADGEVRLAEALKAWKGERPVIATKTKQTDSLEVAKARYAESRERLGSIDFYAEHDALVDYAPEVRRALYQWLNGLRESGEITALGIGGGGPVVQAQWFAEGRFDYIITHNRLNAVSLAGLKDSIPQAKAHGAFILNASPIHYGLLYDPDAAVKQSPMIERSEVFYQRAKTVQKIAIEAVMPLSQLALRFALSLPMADMILSGAATPEEWEDCLTAFELGPLPADLYAEVWIAAQSFGQEPMIRG